MIAQSDVMINANTGEVQGDSPISFWKVAIIVVVIISIIILFVLAQ